jgi:hypothetical protein
VSGQSCWSSDTPLGALPPVEPVWCTDLGSGPSTFDHGDNSWLDMFDHGLSDADLGGGYRVFGDGASQQFLPSQHWRHADHWMVDVRGRDAPGAESNFGGTAMRPDRSFRYVNGRLVVEADVAAGIDEYGGEAWPELVVTTGPQPTSDADVLYGFGQFRGHWSVGCRLHSFRGPICALHNASSGNARVWEVASHLSEGAQIFGGGAFTPELDQAWRVCRGTDPDTNCRDRFRMELTRDSLTLYVNGVRYFAASQFPAGKTMDALVDADVYAYFASWIYRPPADTVRFHWDRIAVNPATPPSAASGIPGRSDASAHGH